MSASFGVAPVPDTTVIERSRQPALGLALPVELQARRADHHRRVGAVGLQRGQRLDRLAEPLLVGQERPPRLQRVGDARALERPQLAAERGLDLQRRPVVRPRAADVDDRAVVLRPQAVEHVGGVRPDLDAEPAQVVLERLEQVGVDRQRAAVRLAGGQLEEGGDRLRVPVHVELEPRLPHALDQRQRGRRRLEPDPQPLGAARGTLVEARALHLVERLRDLRVERQPQPAAARVGQRRQLLRQLARDRLEREAPGAAELARAHAPDPAGDRLGQPRLDLRRDLQPVVALDHALDVGRGAVGLQRPPLLGVPVEAAAGDRADGVDHLAHVREGEDHGLVPVAVAAELDVVDGVGFAHAVPG